MKRIRFVIFLLASGPMIWAPKHSRGEIVYDSLSGATMLNGGIVLSDSIITEAGNIISLEGNNRTVSRADVALRGFNSGGLDFKLNFWSAVGVLPGDLIWSSDVQHSGSLTQVSQIISIDVPLIDVPDTFAWTVEHINDFGAPGIPGYPGPSIGTINTGLVHQLNVWSLANVGNNSHGFRLYAVPEPAVTTLIGIFVMVILAAHRRRRHA